MATDLDREEQLLAQTATEIEQLGDRLGASGDDDRRARDEFDRKMEIYLRQITELKRRFPDAPMARAFEASYYGYQAIRKFQAAGAMRKAAKLAAQGAGKAAKSGGGLIGMAVGLTGAMLSGTAAIGAAAIAKQQERANAKEALVLLDQAIALFDSAGPHMTKATIHAALDEKEQAINELDYVITRFPNDDNYIDARRFKDELLTPPKKRGWF